MTAASVRAAELAFEDALIALRELGRVDVADRLRERWADVPDPCVCGEINTRHCPVHAEPTWVARLVDMLLSPAEATRFESLVLEQHLTPDDALDRLFRDRALTT